MNHIPNNEKPKEKKKSFVERFLYFASHTMRFNKKSEQSFNQDKPKATFKHMSRNLDFNTLQSPAKQISTFCDYCDKKIVVDFTGQSIIYHDSCKINSEHQLSLDNNGELETTIDLLSSIKSEIFPLPYNTTLKSQTKLNARLSASLSDISLNDDQLTMIVKSSSNKNKHDNCLVDKETGIYTFSTVDLSTIKQYGISIKKVPSVACYVPGTIAPCIEVPAITDRSSRASSTSIDFMKLLPEDLRSMIEIFNNNDQGLFVEPKCDQIMGKVRVFINLLRPIKMLLTARPPSIFDCIPDNEKYGDQSTMERAYYNKEVIFWLPRGTTKLLYVNINCTTAEVISQLLDKFNIKNNPKKFALYQHTVKSSTEVEVCKLKSHQCPLKITLNWCHRSAEYFHENLESKKFVLQENDPGSIEWEEFSAPELRSFIAILDMEKEEKRRAIEKKYNAVRNEITRLLTAR